MPSRGLRNLAEVGREYARMEISKEDPFRLRFGELIGADWAGVEDGFFGMRSRT